MGRLYIKFAICNYLGMSKLFDSRSVALAPRPWLTRDPDECAFPVEGDGAGVMSCCNPCGPAEYCSAHASAMRGPPAPPVAQLELEILRWLERRR